MKKILFLFVLIIASSNVLAQSSKKITGPKAKNSKPWQHKKTKTILIVDSFENEKLVGPKFKNRKVWERKITGKKIIVKTKNRKKLQGPKAKNSKPWEK